MLFRSFVRQIVPAINFVCHHRPDCSFETQSSYFMRRHLFQKHREGRPPFVSKCGVPFYQRSSWKTHVERHGCNKPKDSSEEEEDDDTRGTHDKNKTRNGAHGGDETMNENDDAHGADETEDNQSEGVNEEMGKVNKSNAEHIFQLKMLLQNVGHAIPLMAMEVDEIDDQQRNELAEEVRKEIAPMMVLVQESFAALLGIFGPQDNRMKSDQKFCCVKCHNKYNNPTDATICFLLHR